MDKIKLTNADMIAIRDGSDGYINSKGANLYIDGTYNKAVEYYRLGAAMGNIHSISNLGYCYLYGRDIEKNTSLAIAYFTLASKKEDVDATYKLGDIYSSDKYGVKDTELSMYYYRLAIEFVLGYDWRNCQLEYAHVLDDYPSLCFAIARETFPGGNLKTDLDVSYHFLKHAEIGFKIAINNGNSFYRDYYNKVCEMLRNDKYDNHRREIDDLYDEEYSC